MLHTRVVDIKDKKLSIIDAEKFISSSDFGASIFFSGTVRNQNNDKNMFICYPFTILYVGLRNTKSASQYFLSTYVFYISQNLCDSVNPGFGQNSF